MEVAREKRRRLVTIDVLKGASMVMIWYCHYLWNWSTADYKNLFKFQWLVLDFFGPAMFVTMSMVGSMLSSYTRKSSKKPVITQKLLLKVLFMILIAEIMNFISLSSLGFYFLSGWNVILSIAVFTLLLPRILSLRKEVRLALLLLVLVTYNSLVNWALGGLHERGIFPKDLTSQEYFSDFRIAIYYFLFDQRAMAPILPWIAIPLIISLVYEGFASAFSREVDGERRRKVLSRQLNLILYFGILMVSTGVLLGLKLDVEFATGSIGDLGEPGAYFTYPLDGIPLFLLRHTPQYIIYNVGIASILFAILSRKELLDGKFPRGRKFMTPLGRHSLTAFLLSHLGFIFVIPLSLPMFYVVFVPMMLLTILWFKHWSTSLKGVGSVEWLMAVFVSRVGRAVTLQSTQERGKPGQSRRDSSINTGTKDE